MTNAPAPPRVAVIVACYNFGHFLPETLESLQAQTFPAWECAVVDDGSTDDTVAVAQRFAASDPRIRVLQLEHRGVSAARNAGIAATTAEFIQFLDADDLLVPSKFAQQVRFLDERRDCAVTYGAIAYFRTDSPTRLMRSPFGHLSQPLLNARIHGSEEALRKLEVYNFLHPSAGLWRRDLLVRAGMFSETTRASEDWELWIKCAVLGGRFDRSDNDEPVALVRIHPAAATRNPGKMMRGLIEAANAFPRSPAAASWRRSRLPLIYEVATAIQEHEQGFRVRASRRIRAAARACPKLLTSIRWNVYAVAALLLGPRAFFRFVTMPLPEQSLELYRRAKGWARRVRRAKGKG